jgi:putative acetyltransferase
VVVSFSPADGPQDVVTVMPLRHATPADVPALAAIYTESARVLAASFYTAEQVHVWSSWPDDLTEFSRRLAEGSALVSVVAGEIAAFGQLHPLDYIALLYTAPRYARQGHASAICEALEAQARKAGIRRIHTTASLLSRPLFLKQGFTLFEVEQTVFHGVPFERYKMEKILAEQP